MRTHPCLRITFVGTLACLGLMPTAAASATTNPAGHMTYSCVSDTSIVSSATPVTFTLSGAPSAVVAGTSVTLGGTLAVSLPGADTLAPKLGGAKSMGVQSSTFGIQLDIGGKSTVLANNLAVGPPVPIASPTIVKASVTFPDITIPRNAGGELVISMPTSAEVAHQVSSAPAKVVFGAVLNQDSLLASEQKLDCSASHGAQSVVIARIPITPAPHASAMPSPAASASPSSGSGSLPAVSGVMPAPSIAVAAPSSTPVSSVPATSTPASAAPVSALASAPIPPRTVGKGTFIPTWSLVLTGALIPGAFVYYAANQRKKLRRYITSQGL